MGTILQWDDLPRRKECLACHGAVVTDESTRHETFKVEEGVTCAICHGAYFNWIGPHYNPADRGSWRRLGRADKETKYGMRDLWDPVKRSALCTSCHVGNAAEGKFITHQMYAAGHPPLPAFEPAVFSGGMRHWQYLREKDADIQKLLQFKGGEREQTKLVLVGAAVSLAESMRLLAGQCREYEQAADEEARGLDLANFDCYACHHDLKAQSWRQQYGFAGTPGRVPMRPWPTALVRLAVRQAAGDSKDAESLTAELDKHLQHVRDGFDVRPFGNPARIAPAADALAAWAKDLARQVNNKPCDTAAARSLLAQIPSLYQDGTPDYDSARQVAWAFKVVYEELGDTQDAEVKRILAVLHEQLKLDLPAGRGKAEEQKENELREGQKVLNGYNPEAFKNALKDLSRHLGKK
jgi:hypothetical protein